MHMDRNKEKSQWADGVWKLWRSHRRSETYTELVLKFTIGLIGHS